MNTYRITIRYDGGRYKGWQRLGKDAGGDTIQSKIEAVMSTLCGEDVLVTGSGRTDAGVHALAQTAHFRCSASLSPDDIIAHANRYLPDDIAVTEARIDDERFHARYKVLEKHYIYRLDTHPWTDPFERKYSWHVPGIIDYEAMRRAAGMLLGEHDFSAFTSMKSKKKSAVKNLKSIEIVEPPSGKDRIAVIRIVADGFLHNMVRIIIGTLVEVGLGERTPDSVAAVLKSLQRSESGARAPAKGLFLERAVY